MSRDYSETLSIDFRVSKTNRSFIFHNSGSIDIPNKFLISATVIDRSIEDTEVINQKSNLTKGPRQKLQW